MSLKYAGMSLIFLGLSAGIAQAADKPVIPFENYSKVALDETSMLRFDDYAGKIPDSRIKRLMRSGPILGDRVLLRNDVAVYFPDGHIVSTKVEFHNYRPVGNLMAWHVYTVDQVEPEPRYTMIDQFDSVYGQACAQTLYVRGSDRRGGESFARLRRNGHGIVTFELDTPGRYDYLTGETTRSYTMTSALDPYYLGDPQVIQALSDSCRSGVPAKSAELHTR